MAQETVDSILLLLLEEPTLDNFPSAAEGLIKEPTINQYVPALPKRLASTVLGGINNNVSPILTARERVVPGKRLALCSRPTTKNRH